LKRRGTDIKDMQDIYAERIFKDESKSNTQVMQTPSFTSTPVFEKEASINFSAFEPSFKDLQGDGSPF
jgi:hypothetical protein